MSHGVLVVGLKFIPMTFLLVSIIIIITFLSWAVFIDLYSTKASSIRFDFWVEAHRTWFSHHFPITEKNPLMSSLTKYIPLFSYFVVLFNILTPTIWQTNTHNPMDSGISYPRCSFPGSVAPNMVTTNTNVRSSSIPKAWAPFKLCAGAVTPSPPRTSVGVRPYRSAAPKIPEKNA